MDTTAVEETGTQRLETVGTAKETQKSLEGMLNKYKVSVQAGQWDEAGEWPAGKPSSPWRAQNIAPQEQSTLCWKGLPSYVYKRVHQ